MLLWSYITLLIGAGLAGLLFNLSYRLACADKIESKRSAARSRTPLNAILGRARIHDDFMPDARVKAGLIYNKKKKRIEISGRLSPDSLKRVFR